MLVFNYTLNICPAVGIRVAPIRTSFQTLPPLLLPGFRFLVISSLVYILSPDVYRVPCIFLFFFLPLLLSNPPSLRRESDPRFRLRDENLSTARSVDWDLSFFFSSFFEEGTEDTVGFFGSLTRTFPLSRGTGLIMTGKRGKRERGEGLKHRHPKIRHCKFYWKSSLRIMRRYLRRICHLLSITELINISDNIILLRND